MKIGMQTWGSDGDILPFLALARGLRKSGHRVTVVYTSVDNKDYSKFADEFDISIIKAYGKFDEEKASVFSDITKTKDALKELSLILKNYFDPAVDEMYARSRKLCAENDLVIGHAIHYPLAIAAELAQCPRVSVALCPMAIESRFFSPFGGNLGKWLNSVLWKMGDRIVRKKVYQSADLLREKEGLKPFENLQDELYVSKELTLIATSKQLCARPPDWGDNLQVCGFLDPPKKTANWEMDQGVKEFLKSGEPPVYFTFGSCTQFDLEKTTSLFVDAAQKTGVRAIIQSDWSGIEQEIDDPNIYPVESLPHEYVFPHCALVVHHGGSGTTQAALKAGKPSVVVAHAFDQPYWGKKLYGIGAAGKVLRRQSVSAEKLAVGMKKVLGSPELTKNASRIGQIMRTEDGVTNAVALIEQVFAKFL